MTLIVRQHTSITDTLRGCFCLKKKNGYYIMSKREINMVVTKSELIVKTGKWGRQQTSQAWAVLLSHFRPYDDTRRRREVLCLAQEYKNILPARVERPARFGVKRTNHEATAPRKPILILYH